MLPNVPIVMPAYNVEKCLQKGFEWCFYISNIRINFYCMNRSCCLQ